MYALVAFFTTVAVFSFSKAQSDPCRMLIELGLCLAYFPSWGYEQSTGQCVEFIYGGCQGNLNRFYSKEECEATSTILSTAQQARLPEMLAKEAFGYYELLNELFHAKVAALLLTAQVITATAVVLPWRR
ncbi:Kunitz-type serine protease inhibitor BmTI-A [Echinococcus granulosus]|uniref:Kunitz-type serine protease inhibitor BmTI-A n=1 Tax=Echinococcus granulosus TaxID=6210 RepID=W6UWN9_ECHGR|nr:Kunitz-type serine protease inhibitor BmTI-A [Echinococcus granulosus]EUB57904.1 Kunitz-type serine protease inhibitor BmTI-A [Echinococcus granulosus]